MSKTNEFLLSLEYLHYIKLVGMKLNAYEYIFNNYLSSVKYSEYHIFLNYFHKHSNATLNADNQL